MIKLNSKQLRKGERGSERQDIGIKNEIYIILDNVLDTYNVGAIFRLADAVAAKKVYLCGKTETPPNPRIKKSSINTTEWVEWEYTESALSAIQKLRSKINNLKVLAIEQTDRSIPYTEFEYKLPIALIIGNETYGVSKEVLEASDAAVELPMFGVNISLNVMVSLGIVLYHTIQYKH